MKCNMNPTESILSYTINEASKLAIITFDFTQAGK